TGYVPPVPRRPVSEPTLDGLALHGEFRRQTFDVGIDRSHREHAAVALVAQHAVPGCDIAIDRKLVPGRSVSDIVDGYVVVLAPEERHGSELLLVSEHVARRSLTLTLGNDPVLHANCLAAVCVRTACDVASGENSWNAGF